MSGSTYQPADGLVVLSEADHRALLAHVAGRSGGPAAAALVAAGAVSGAGALDPPLRPVASALRGAGPRLRLLSRRRGELTVNDLAVHPGGLLATLTTRPAGSTGVHLRPLSAGGAARHLARRIGLGASASWPQGDLRGVAGTGGERAEACALAQRGVAATGELDWPAVLAAFATPGPSGWAAAHADAALHELRTARRPGDPVRTVFAAACLDGLLVEIAPASPTRPTRYRVVPADPPSLWRRLCAAIHPSRAAVR